MARRKIQLQSIEKAAPDQAISDLVKGLGDTKRAFIPTEQSVYARSLIKMNSRPRRPWSSW